MRFYLRFLSVLFLSVLAAACGGGGESSGGGTGGSGGTPTNRIGYAVDDYVVEGNVNVYRAGTTNVLFTTTTGDFGSFTLPGSITGLIKVEITGGFEDIDGVSSTTDDRKPFDKSLITLINADSSNAVPVVVSALTTGIETYAAGDFTKFQQAIGNLPTDVKKLVDMSDILSNDTKQKERLESVKTTTRIMGFDSIVNELRDDGILNKSNGGTNASEMTSVLQAASATGGLSSITDTALKLCISKNLQTSVENVTTAQLLSITDLSCSGAGITSISGIEALSNLEYLNLSDNDISDISSLVSLPNLSWLSVFDNRVKNISTLDSGRFSVLAINLGENCITDLQSITGSTKIILSGYNRDGYKQYVDCNKNDAKVTLLKAFTTSSGKYRLLFRTTYNAAAVCSIDWGDGQSESVACDARPHNFSHDYNASPTAPVIFKVNGVESARVSFALSDVTTLFNTELSKVDDSDLPSYETFTLDGVGMTEARYEWNGSAWVTGINTGSHRVLTAGGWVLVPKSSPSIIKANADHTQLLADVTDITGTVAESYTMSAKALSATSLKMADILPVNTWKTYLRDSAETFPLGSNVYEVSSTSITPAYITPSGANNFINIGGSPATSLDDLLVSDANTPDKVLGYSGDATSWNGVQLHGNAGDMTGTVTVFKTPADAIVTTQNIIGTATWARKTVSDVEMVEVNLPDNLRQNNHTPFFAYFNGVIQGDFIPAGGTPSVSYFLNTTAKTAILQATSGKLPPPAGVTGFTVQSSNNVLTLNQRTTIKVQGNSPYAPT